MDVHDDIFGAPPRPDDDARWAASGALALTGPADGPPVLPPRSLVPAVRAAGDSVNRATQRLGNAVDIDGLALLGERAAIAGLTRRGRTSCGSTSELVASADGWIAVSLARADDVALLPAWIGTDDLRRGVSGRAGSELIDRGVELGLPCARLGEVTTASPAFSVDHLAPGVARDDVREALVVDLSALWAGPLCGHLLRLAGARVVKVESVHRPDGARRGPARFYDLLHAGQESVAIDFTAREQVDRLQRLLETADIVIEGSRPRALAQLGIDARALAARGRPTVWVSITGHGRSGPAASRVGFGDDAAVAGGLVAGRLDEPWFCADAIADPVTGLVATACVLDRFAAGGAYLIDVALARVAAWCARLPSVVDIWTGDVAAPAARAPAGVAPRSGADTDRVLAEVVP